MGEQSFAKLDLQEATKVNVRCDHISHYDDDDDHDALDCDHHHFPVAVAAIMRKRGRRGMECAHAVDCDGGGLLHGLESSGADPHARCRLQGPTIDGHDEHDYGGGDDGDDDGGGGDHDHCGWPRVCNLVRFQYILLHRHRRCLQFQ